MPVDLYDVVLPDLVGLSGVARRSVFVVDRGGVVRYCQVTEIPSQQPDCDALYAAIGRAT